MQQKITSSNSHHLALIGLGLFFLFSPLPGYPLPSSPSELRFLVSNPVQQLSQRAEYAMRNEEYMEAKAAFSSILQQEQISNLPLRTYVDILYRLAIAERYLSQYSEAEGNLYKALKLPLPEDLLLRIELLRAKLRNDQSAPGDAYQVLNQLNQRVPHTHWPVEDQAFLLALEYVLEEACAPTLEKLHALEVDSRFQEALPLYKIIIQAIDKGRFPKTLSSQDKEAQLTHFYRRLAEAHLSLNNYSEVVTSLLPQLPRWKALPAGELSENGRHCFYLIAAAYRLLNEDRKAINALETYLHLADPSSLPYYEPALWEIGFAYANLGESTKAKRYWHTLCKRTQDPSLKSLTSLSLAKLALKQQLYEEVVSWLPLSSSSTGEVAYLQAEAFFHLHNYSQAITLFEATLSSTPKYEAPWYAATLFNLGWSHIKISENSAENQLVHLQKAEELFSRLGHFLEIEQVEEKPSYPSKHQLNLAKSRIFLLKGTPESLSLISSTLSASLNDLSLEERGEALLMLAKAANSFEERESWYVKLLDSTDLIDCSSIAKGWYFRGLNCYEEGKKKESEPTALPLFLNATAYFSKSQEALLVTDPLLAALALKFQAYAYSHLKTEEALTCALFLLDKLIHHKEKLFLLLKRPDEVIYSHGLFASQLWALTEDEKFKDLAELSLKQLLTQFESSPYADQALFNLATLEYQSGQPERALPYFKELSQHHPNSHLASESCFWAAQCAEEATLDDEQVRTLRKKVYELYPESPYAPEAYFRFYSFTDYLNEESEPLNHLNKMQQLYPSSPFLAIAKYLLALNAKHEKKNLSDAIIQSTPLQLLQEARALFETNLMNQRVPKEQKDYFLTLYYRTRLEIASLNLELFEQEGVPNYALMAEEGLKQIIDEFNNKADFAVPLLQNEAFPRVFEESLFTLAKLYKIDSQDEKSSRFLAHLIQTYQELQVEVGYYLSRSWYELAKLSMKQHNYSLALKQLVAAEESGQNGSLSSEQRLDLWIQKSYCYRESNQTDLAMLMLSRVINENATSSLRIKAMLLRAEIYALQGREELAMKQLEAVTHKGGEWAQQAKERLHQDYGYP